MNKTNQFSAKVQYVTPSCKSVVLHARESILVGSYGEEGRAGSRGFFSDETNEEDY